MIHIEKSHVCAQGLAEKEEEFRKNQKGLVIYSLVLAEILRLVEPEFLARREA